MGCGRQVTPEWHFLLAAVAGLLACESPPPDPVPEAIVSDSAGVRIVDWTPLNLSALPETTTQRVGSTGDSGVELYRVRAGLLISDSVVLVANAGSGEILWLDRRLRVTRRVGRIGDGPGEYRNISWIGVGDSSTVWVFDRDLGRLTQLDSGGAVLSTRVLVPDRSLVTLKPLVHLNDGSTVAVYAESREHFRLGLSESRDTVPLLLFGAEGSLDTLGIWPGQERGFAQVSMGIAAVPVGFARHLEAAGRGVRAAVGSTDFLDISVFDGGPNLVLEVRGQWPEVPVSPADVASWRKAILQRLPTDNDEYRRTWEDGPVRPTRPAFERLVVDSDGRIWIGRHATPDASAREWVMADRDGRPVARVSLPAAFHPLTPPVELLDAQGDLVLVLRRSEVDEEIVELLQMGRS
jgi:hypothetical protein